MLVVLPWRSARGVYDPRTEEGGSDFVLVSWTFGGEPRTNLVNLISNDASEAGVMAQCPSVRDFQLNTFSGFSQIQFLNQQLCAKTWRKQEKNLCFCTNIAFGLCFPFWADVTLLSARAWSVPCTASSSVSRIKPDKTVCKLHMVKKMILNLQVKNIKVAVTQH